MLTITLAIIAVCFIAVPLGCIIHQKEFESGYKQCIKDFRNETSESFGEEFTKDGDAIFLKTDKEPRNAVFDGSRKKIDKSDENDWKFVDQPAILGYSDDSIYDDSRWFKY